VALVRTDFSGESRASVIRVTTIGELGTSPAVTNTQRTLWFLCSVRWVLVTAGDVPSSTIVVTLITEALRSSETTVLTRATSHNILEDNILHSYHRENHKSYLIR
jgi:hypothetical protein